MLNQYRNRNEAKNVRCNPSPEVVAFPFWLKNGHTQQNSKFVTFFNAKRPLFMLTLTSRSISNRPTAFIWATKPLDRRSARLIIPHRLSNDNSNFHVVVSAAVEIEERQTRKVALSYRCLCFHKTLAAQAHDGKMGRSDLKRLSLLRSKHATPRKRWR